MTWKHLAASAAAAAAALAATPALSNEMHVAPTTTFFVSIPLDAATRRDQAPNFGLQFQGAKPYQTVKLDYQTFQLLPGAHAAAEWKYVAAGAVALGAAVAIARKDKARSETLRQQQAEQAENCARTVNNC
jgi:hypothetical protein